MNPDYFGLVEMVFSFGVVIGLALWELRSVQSARKKKRESPPSEEGE
jgi:hypothetical protein